MKNFVKGMIMAVIAVTLSTMGVNATTSKSIDTNACDTVYTNYYFFLDANVYDTLYAGYTHSTTAVYYTNSYRVNFDSSNVGYGQVKLTTSTSTSSDGITSMSLSDYYKMYINAVNSNGTYTSGLKTYIASHDWYAEGSTTAGDTLDLSSYTTTSLKNATVNATSNIVRNSNIKYSSANPFSLSITRVYASGNTSGKTPITYENNSYYLHPAVYYVQYCAENSIDTYTIYYESNGSNVTNMPSDTTFDENECTTISTKTPKRSGYTFLGWSTSSTATSANSKYASGSDYCTNSDLTLYAVWKKNDTTTYTITYKANGTNVSNVPSSSTFDEDECTTISTTIPTRSGYTFLGWSTSSTATSANSKYASGSDYCTNSDLTLYAVWQKNDVDTYTVVYNSNTTDTVSNLPGTQTVSVDSDTVISTTTPVRSGYTFLGWSTDATATVADSNYASGSTYTDRKNLVLYAIWQKNDATDTGTVDNPQTGISSYIIPFGSVSIASGIGLNVLKRKKSFKQF